MHTFKCLGVDLYVLACEFCLCMYVYVNLGVCVQKLSTRSRMRLGVCQSEPVIPVSTFLVESGPPR